MNKKPVVHIFMKRSVSWLHETFIHLDVIRNEISQRVSFSTSEEIDEAIEALKAGKDILEKENK